jgi:hypothetical protein
MKLLPVVPRVMLALDEGERRRLQAVAARILAEEPALTATRAFGARPQSGIRDGRWLVIGDASEIALAKAAEAPAYQHRLSLLARAGDLVVFGGAPHAAFQHYRAQSLGFGPVDALHPAAVPAAPLLPLADRCRLDGAVLAHIVAAAQQQDGLTIVPHIGMDSVWRLAGAVAAATGLDIRVMGPPPRLTRRVNDKLWFARLVREVVGPHATPPTWSAHGLAVLAARVRALAKKSDRVVIKVPDSSGGSGNICLAACDLLDAPLASVRDRVFAMLRATGWYDVYPLLVGLWETPALGSPSVQLWIPAAACGPPVIEGIFEQILEGREGVFVGSIPAQLPRGWTERIAREAMRLATVLQRLGYFGRCSMDALLIGTALESARLHWIECNGRWGGVSIPMTLVNRLCGGATPREFVVVERCEDNHAPRPFAHAVRDLDGLLLGSGGRRDGVILLTPTEIESGRGVQLLACADTVAAARALADRAVGILCGLSGSSESCTVADRPVTG